MQDWKGGDTLVLEEQLPEGFWKVKRNGSQSVVLLLEVEDEKIRKALVGTVVHNFNLQKGKAPERIWMEDTPLYQKIQQHREQG